MKILVMETSLNLSDLCQCLSGSEIHIVHHFEELEASMFLENFDCVVADISLNNISTQIIKSVKRLRKGAGIILIAQHNILERKIEALTDGADDYLIWPFDVSELAARIVSIVKRIESFKLDDLFFNEIRINFDAKTVSVNDLQIDLTKKEYELLLYLIDHKNIIINKEILAAFLSGQICGMKSSVELIYAHVKNLKRKLGAAGCKPYLKTIYGIGYKWEVN